MGFLRFFLRQPAPILLVRMDRVGEIIGNFFGHSTLLGERERALEVDSGMTRFSATNWLIRLYHLDQDNAN